MTKKIPGKMIKAKAISAHKKVRRTSPRLIHRDRKDLQFKNYLMEDHPELSLPLDDAKPAKTDRVSRAAKH
jgi:hypothetical protein